MVSLGVHVSNVQQSKFLQEYTSAFATPKSIKYYKLCQVNSKATKVQTTNLTQ